MLVEIIQKHCFAHFNIPISIQGKTIQTLPYAIEHIQPRDFHVPGDISSAAFFIVAALITPVVTLQFIMLALIPLVQVS